MMKYLVTALLLNALFVSAAHSRNCSNASVALHNKHCSASSGNSTSQSQSITNTGGAGQSPDKATTNSHLGSGAQTQQPVVQVHPLAPMVITGTSLVTSQTLTTKPQTITGQKPVQVNPILPPVINAPTKPPQQPTIIAPPKTFIGQTIQVHPTPTPIITGVSAVPLQPIRTLPSKTFTGQAIQVSPTPTPIITGVSAVPPQPIKTLPSKTFTGQAIQVNPTPTPIITGVSAVPPQPIRTLPSKTFTGQAIQVNPTPTPMITGVSAVPLQPISILPPKTFTSPPRPNAYPVPTPIFIGNKPISATPLINAPTKPNTPMPNNVPSMVSTKPVVTRPPTVAPENKPVIITHVASSNLHPDVLLQQQMLRSSANLNSLEPHINNLPVDVYTNKNTHNTTYGKSNTIDNNGFHLTVLGIKEEIFIDTSPPLVAVNPDDIIFNFNYASADIHKDQLSQVDKIIAKHSKNGKQIILMGETDGFGSEDYNKHLALLRAHKIIDELKKRGARTDDIEIRILVRCCRKGHPTKEILAETTAQRITWVHFQ